MRLPAVLPDRGCPFGAHRFMICVMSRGLEKVFPWSSEVTCHSFTDAPWELSVHWIMKELLDSGYKKK
jgi:hypothetical protein